ncbi:hypothetical protein H8S90_13820 [Olivibacter sp. SDN3]|uniref:hypothetical protein n=1 Tax=Olivibacter sp. SDN3 TaxID=2764720 RepID=UPI001650E195|nr:hypothetical protein [Olivibacter sp. SDN3]QNL47896.1 hypothetical protein H8S90_13820 [Olivibacter sp. SDN3]
MKTLNLPIFVASFIFVLSLIFLNFVNSPVKYLVASLGLLSLTSIAATSLKNVHPAASHIEVLILYPLHKTCFALGFFLFIAPFLIFFMIWLGVANQILGTTIAAQLFLNFSIDVTILLAIIVLLAIGSTFVMGHKIHNILTAGYYDDNDSTSFRNHRYGKKSATRKEFVDAQLSFIKKYWIWISIANFLLPGISMLNAFEVVFSWIKEIKRK